ncbi:hypothetical protein YC2023_099341 [Brassica napus]
MLLRDGCEIGMTRFVAQVSTTPRLKPIHKLPFQNQKLLEIKVVDFQERVVNMELSGKILLDSEPLGSAYIMGHFVVHAFHVGMDPSSQKMRSVVETSEDHGTCDVVGETFS